MLTALALAMAAGGALLLMYLRRKKGVSPPQPSSEQSQQQQEDRRRQEKQREQDEQRQRAAQERRRSESQNRRNELLDKVVNELNFATQRAILEQVKVGEREEISPVPTEHVNVRPIQSVAEIPRVLPSMNQLDDDMFFGRLAAHQLPVTEYTEKVDVVVTRIGEPKKILVAIIDVSQSMNEHERIVWAKQLCRRLIERCKRERVEIAIIPFNHYVHDCVRAKTPEEIQKLDQNLDETLRAGGDTNIDLALEAGIQLVHKGKFEQVRMLLVTDGTQGITEQSVKENLALVKAQLHTVCIAGDHTQLRRVSHRFDVLLDSYN